MRVKPETPTLAVLLCVQAVYAEPLAAACRILEQGLPKLGCKVAIIGVCAYNMVPHQESLLFQLLANIRLPAANKAR